MKSPSTFPPSTDESDAAVVAAEIAKALSEPRAYMVKRVVRTIGAERARAFLEKTLQVEAEGGLLVSNGSRRRTPGGVFFYLVREEASPEERDRIFNRRKKKKGNGAPSPPPPPPPAPLQWEEREAYVDEALTEPGRASVVKLTIIGRPKKIVDAKSSVITVFQNPDPPQSLPKGLPQPTATQTPYAVFIAKQQWQKVAGSLQEHEEDELIIEGYPYFEPKLSGMAVLAQKVTTKLMERARREGKKS